MVSFMALDITLLGGGVKINQFRNVLYELVLLLREKKKMTDEELISELRDMSHSIFETYEKSIYYINTACYKCYA